MNRLYLTFVLYALLKETNIWSVSEKFNMSRGYVQNLLSSAASFASCLLHFCEVLCHKNVKKFFVVWFCKIWSFVFLLQNWIQVWYFTFPVQKCFFTFPVLCYFFCWAKFVRTMTFLIVKATLMRWECENTQIVQGIDHCQCCWWNNWNNASLSFRISPALGCSAEECWIHLCNSPERMTKNNSTSPI